MAGDVEEPFRIHFQGDFVISDSISFGRFESESLSWERRSSFSHNRYLEEVEKYSKPGSVNEKKAYFEAHFKKKGGLLGQNLPESYDGHVYHTDTAENGILEKVDQGSDFENVNNEDHVNDSLDSPKNHGDHEVLEIEIPSQGISFSDHRFGASFDSAGCSMEEAIKVANFEIKEQSNTEEKKLLTFVRDAQEIEIKQRENILPAAIDLSPKAELVKRAGKSSSETQQTRSVKMMTSKRETKSSKPQADIRQNRRSISGDALKSPEKVSNKSRGKPPQQICTEKHGSKTASLNTHAVHRTPKIVDSRVIKGKANLESISSEKGRSFRESNSSALKLESRSYLKASRHNQVVNSALQDTGKSAPASNFRSIESVERRKQFHPKSEDRMHIKEADRFKSPARTQVKADAETKKLQKNLDIKSKPISSSYGAVRPESDRKKAVIHSTKVRNTLRKSTAVGSSSHSAFGKDTGSSASEANTSSSIPSGNQLFIPDQVKEKDHNVQRSRVSESCGVSKGLVIEGKQKVGARRTTNSMGRRHTKGVTGSGMNRLAVGVTS